MGITPSLFSSPFISSSSPSHFLQVKCSTSEACNTSKCSVSTSLIIILAVLTPLPMEVRLIVEIDIRTLLLRIYHFNILSILFPLPSAFLSLSLPLLLSCTPSFILSQLLRYPDYADTGIASNNQLTHSTFTNIKIHG